MMFSIDIHHHRKVEDGGGGGGGGVLSPTIFANSGELMFIHFYRSLFFGLSDLDFG